MSSPLTFLARSLFVVLVGAIIIGSLLPIELAPRAPFLSDKVEHLAAYLITSFLGAYVFGDTGRKRLWQLALGLIIMGVVLEVGQNFVPGRYAEVVDGIVNAVGVALGMALGWVIRARQRRSIAT